MEKKSIPEQFKLECAEEITAQGGDRALSSATREWMNQANARKYSYHFEWLGRPIMQYPQDIVAIQEIIWKVKPDLIIETGIAHGGSLILSASMLELNAACGGPLDAEVLGIDVDIRSHNREAIEAHPMSKRISMLQGSSIEPNLIEKVKAKAAKKSRVMVILDSNHTHDHVLAELEAYAPITSIGSYCVVFDTVIEDMPDEMFPNRPWSRGNNPKTAVCKYLALIEKERRKGVDNKKLTFEVDQQLENKLLITVAPNGYLRRI